VGQSLPGTTDAVVFNPTHPLSIMFNLAPILFKHDPILFKPSADLVQAQLDLVQPRCLGHACDATGTGATAPIPERSDDDVFVPWPAC
jgi:hypothetical protein